VSRPGRGTRVRLVMPITRVEDGNHWLGRMVGAAAK